MRIHRMTMSVFLAGIVGACSAGTPSQEQADTDSVGRIGEVGSDLGLGSSGSEVKALNAYLTRFGYFPSETLARQYPSWRPIVARAPQDPNVFDTQTEQAVRALQQNAGREPTGRVDAATRTLLNTLRCSVPDGIQRLDTHDRYALWDSGWGKFDITWKVNNTANLNIWDVRAAADRAFTTWSTPSSLTFRQVMPGEPADIEIQFAASPAPHSPSTNPPSQGGDITLDANLIYAVGPRSTFPAGEYDLEAILLHEIGHALGLADSSYFGGAMYNWFRSGSYPRTLTLDDQVAVSALYDTWTQLPGGAVDRGAGQDGSLWAIGMDPVGPSDYGIHKFDAANWRWVETSEWDGAIRIAVEKTGIPWIVNSAGAIYRRTTKETSSGYWAIKPGQARDIGIGGNAVWVIGIKEVAPGDYSIHMWDNGDWVEAGGGAVRIAVDSTGIPWIVNSQGQVFRRTKPSAWIGEWEPERGLPCPTARP